MIETLLAFGAALLAGGDGSGQEPPPLFFRGNTHTHTLWSDGDGAPELVADWYRGQGYHFLVLSDHDVLSAGERWFPVSDDEHSRLTTARVADLVDRFGADSVMTRARDGVTEMRLVTLAELKARFESADEFLFIQGEEVTDNYQPRGPGERKLPVHVNAINIEAPIAPQGGDSPADVLNRNIDAIVEHGRQTGRPVLAHVNHPNFGWALTWRDLAAIRGDRFFEVFNGHRSVHNAGDATHDSTEAIWDRALVLRLTELGAGLLYGLASDDTHHYHQAGATAVPGRGWIMVRAEGLAADAIISAMRRGDFYASTGVELRDYSTAGGDYRVDLAPRPGETCSVRFVGTRRMGAGLGPPGEVLLETRDDPAIYRFRGDELYVRAVVTSTLAHPDPAAPGDVQQAWLQPVVPEAIAASAPLTLMSFNLRYASDRQPNAWPDRREACFEAIRGADPDLLGTQEGLAAQLADLDAALPGHRRVGQGRRGGDRDEFCALYYRTDRLELEEAGDFWLSATPDVAGSLSFDADLPRMVTWARLRDRRSGQRFVCANTHFDHAHPVARARSAELLLRWSQGLEEAGSAAAGLPLLVTGDFNAAAKADPVYDTLVGGGWFADLFAEAREPGPEIGTFHGFAGGDSGRGRIDWILGRGGVSALRSSVITYARAGQYPSDHFPVSATVVLEPR